MTTDFDLIERLKNKQPIIGVIGLGYVGLPLAVAFGKLFTTIGFDINKSRVNSLKNFEDPSGETSGEEMVSAKFLSFTCDPKDLAKCSAFIIAVPTPVDKNNRPDISPLISASKTVGSVMKSGSLVVYESTVYPGCTEEDCVPVLELTSGKKLNKDFFVGYSPERINPGDKNHSLKNVVKITSGSCEQAAQVVDWLYSNIALAGTCPVKSIKVAEAAKVIENAQRDINIAFVNELSMIFHRMGIDTQEVLNAACTKWNFRDYRPGLVGGHCFAASQLVTIKRCEEIEEIWTQTIGEYVDNFFFKGDQVLSFDVESRELVFKNILSCSASGLSGVFDNLVTQCRERYDDGKLSSSLPCDENMINNKPFPWGCFEDVPRVKMITITTEFGHKCVITDKHPMLVFEDGSLIVKHAENVVIGDLMPFFYGAGLPSQMLVDKIPFPINGYCKDQILNHKFDKGLCLIPVKSTLTEETVQNVFSLEVEDTKTIVTDNGWIVHNCIGVDPYYLSHKAQEYNYHPEVILAGRRLNDSMGRHVAQEVVKLMILKDNPVKGSSVCVLGCTFKENCADARNSKVFDIIKELKSFGCKVLVVDPFADAEFVKDHYDVVLEKEISDFTKFAAIIVAVAHNDFKTMSFGRAENRKLVVYDVKGILPEEQIDGRL